MSQNDEDLKKDADQILQEIRIVLPGTQALMGFQFIAFFNPVFQGLTQELKLLHFLTLVLTILCSILLIAPVAFQQIGEEGKTTKQFIRFTRQMLTAAMLLLLLSFCGDVFLAGQIIGLSNLSALLVSGSLLLVGCFLWYAHALIRRHT